MEINNLNSKDPAAGTIYSERVDNSNRKAERRVSRKKKEREKNLKKFKQQYG